ncbi:element excision factor XisI family protein [Roseofilum capinflatum]|uniref:Element excision factor XisI family protein n=1 Tax=Roseofilum capinflatum BLCC-M114 TaxID=3022440 RepID=A0ABT7B603_9CYAN|nr:element excision factor XisI family protein [Roseofilum capinflatum]MDJ1174545.1 element excision factor XisI family protein [Roseofilum capinflatum BLCC-M114]
MDRLEHYRSIIRTVLAEHLEWSKSRDIDETIAICDEETDNYLLMSVGWHGDRRIHGILAHLRIIDGLVHIEQNNVEYFAEDLIEQGIPEEVLVPAFCYPPTQEAISIANDQRGG